LAHQWYLKILQKRPLKFKKINVKKYWSKCPACLYQNKLEKIYINELAKGLEDKLFYKAFSESNSLCLKHLIALTENLTNSWLLNQVIEDFKIKLDTNIKLMSSYLKKNEYQNKEKILAEEASAWEEIIKIIEGELS